VGFPDISQILNCHKNSIMQRRNLLKVLNMASNAVPKTTQVIPGAPVSIVLKADQRSGKEVQGVVRDVLTRGDHHRGIKVRLTDGRIGRVQRMQTGPPSRVAIPGNDATGSSPTTSSGGQTVLATDTQLPQFEGRRQRFRDIRSDEPLEAPQEHIDLGAYIVTPKRKGKGRKPPKSEQATGATVDDSPASEPLPADVSSATVTCPVCGKFEGDEAAVAHHVSEHFDQ
jgi:uncharacterized repeat protein (TIGR03833 family)